MSLSRHPHSALAARKQMLIQRSMVLRQTLALQADAAVAPLARGVDRMGAAVAWVKGHPGVVAGVVIALVVWRPRRAIRLLGRTYGLWQGSRRWLPLVARAQALWLASRGGADGKPARPPEGP